MIFQKEDGAICLTDYDNTLVFPLLVEEIEMLRDDKNYFENYINHRNNTSTTRKEDLTHRFYTLMMDNYREHKEVIFYADKLHVSSKYLSEVVKETSGKSPKDWIIDYSLLEIKELLKNSSLNIQEITIRTKFLNQSALGRFFKRHTNMSPSEYRESTY